jgi:hypothetical protein
MVAKQAKRHHRRPRWDSVERVVRLLVSVAGEVAKLIDALHSR